MNAPSTWTKVGLATFGVLLVAALAASLFLFVRASRLKADFARETTEYGQLVEMVDALQSRHGQVTRYVPPAADYSLGDAVLRAAASPEVQISGRTENQNSTELQCGWTQQTMTFSFGGQESSVARRQVDNFLGAMEAGNSPARAIDIRLNLQGDRVTRSSRITFATFTPTPPREQP